MKAKSKKRVVRPWSERMLELYDRGHGEFGLLVVGPKDGVKGGRDRIVWSGNRDRLLAACHLCISDILAESAYYQGRGMEMVAGSGRIE